MLGKTNSSAAAGGSDMFEAQLLLENVVVGGTLKTEDQAAAEVLPVLQTIVGEGNE